MAQLFTSVIDKKLAALLHGGAIGILPTDTVYGLVSVIAPEPVKRLYAAKPRQSHAGTVIASSVDDLIALGLDEAALRHVSHLWPAPLSVVIAAQHVPKFLREERGSLAVRIPEDKTLRSLLQKTGPLMTTSANKHGEKTAATISAAQHIFGDSVDFYVDGGDLSNHPPSTIIMVDAHGVITVLREGAVPVQSLAGA